MGIKIALFVLPFFLFIFSPIVEAKVLPRFSQGNTNPIRKSAGAKGISVYAKLRSDRKALLVTFSNLQLARAVTYILTYKTDGKDEGVSGSVDTSGGSASRELLFGTCSSGVCRYHPNLSNMRLEVVSELTSGKKSVKRFRIKT